MPGPDPDRQIVEGRPYISRGVIEQVTGYTVKTQRNLYLEREQNGHPAGVRIGRSLYFDEETIIAFYRDKVAAIRAGFTPVDRSGDPEELVGIREAAEVLGIRPSTITSYMSRNDDYFPNPENPGGDPHQWRRRTLWEFGDRRSYPGRRGHEHARGLRAAPPPPG